MKLGGSNDMIKGQNPIIVGSPLRGEWLAPNTPGTKIPSHGTDKFGARYAFDFVQVDWSKRGWPAYHGSLLKYLLVGNALKAYYCWGQDVYAPCDGVVVQAKDGYKERPRAHLISDLFKAFKSAHYFNPEKDDVQAVAGNYIVMACDHNVYAALVHLQKGSIMVSVGQRLNKGDLIGKVGHSGNSFMPHLHFQLMDSMDISLAKGVPCAFDHYEVFQEGAWQQVTNGIPKNKDRIRF